MILSQLLHAGAKVEPLKRGQTSHSLNSVVERELGLELDKTHQNSDWGSTLRPQMIEYAAKDVESCSHCTKSSRPRSKKQTLPTLQRSSTERYRLWSG